MRQRFLYLLSLGLIVMIMIVACGSASAPTTAPDEQTAPEQSTPTAPDKHPPPATQQTAPTAPDEQAEAATQQSVPTREETDVPEVEEPKKKTAVPDTLPGDGKTVRIGRSTWDTGWFEVEIFSVLLEKLGYEVADPNTLDDPLFYVSAARGDVDFWPNGWFPLHNHYIEQEDVVGKVELVGNEVRAGGLQGYLVDKKTADAYGITNLEDFKDPDIAALFDSDGNGKADLIGCDPGWECEVVINHHLETYELGDTVEHIQGSYSALMGDTIARFQRGEPVLFYTWTPNWTVHKLKLGDDVVWIEVPFSSLPDDQKDLEDMTIGEGIPGCVADPCNMGFPPNDIRVAANVDFLNDNLSFKILAELVEIPLADIAAQNALMFDGEDSDEDIRRHAEEWVANHQDKVDMWLEAAIAGEMPADMGGEAATRDADADTKKAAAEEAKATGVVAAEDEATEVAATEDVTGTKDVTGTDTVSSDAETMVDTDTVTPTIPLPGEGKIVRMGRTTWETGWFEVELFTLLLEELGYEVEAPSTLDNQAFYLAAARGEVDMWPNGWFPLHSTFLHNKDVEGFVQPYGYEVKAGALQGYLIDKATADKYNITNLEDFHKPEIAALFDTDGNGKADLIGCDPGWGCEVVIAHHLDVYDLRDSIDQVQGSYSALMGDTIARFQRGEPIFFYTWTPNWTVHTLKLGTDVVWIEVPFSSLPDEQKDLEDKTTGEGIAGCVANPCLIGWPPNDIRVVANIEFMDNNPAIKALAEVVEIPMEDIAAQNALMFKGENSDEDIHHHAEEWIQANRDTVDAWLAVALAAAK